MIIRNLENILFERVTSTWCLLGLAMKESWLGPGGPTLTLTTWKGLQITTLTLWGLIFGKEVGSERVYDNREC